MTGADVAAASASLTAAAAIAAARGIHEHRRRSARRQLQEWSGHAPDGATRDRRAVTTPLLLAAAVLCCGWSITLETGRWGLSGDAGGGTRPSVMILLDVSTSMYASDTPPTRLSHAVEWLTRVIPSAPADNIGIVVFAGSISAMCPLTTDRDAILSMIATLDDRSIRARGTAIAWALDRALSALAAAPSTDKRILLISDGEDTGGDMNAAVARAVGQSVRIDTLGVGTRSGAPLPAAPGSTEYQRDPALPDGIAVTTLHDDVLLMLAETTGGIYGLLPDETRRLDVFGGTDAAESSPPATPSMMRAWIVAALAAASVEVASRRLRAGAVRS